MTQSKWQQLNAKSRSNSCFSKISNSRHIDRTRLVHMIPVVKLHGWSGFSTVHTICLIAVSIHYFISKTCRGEVLKNYQTKALFSKFIIGSFIIVLVKFKIFWLMFFFIMTRFEYSCHRHSQFVIYQLQIWTCDKFNSNYFVKIFFSSNENCKWKWWKYKQNHIILN